MRIGEFNYVAHVEHQEQNVLDVPHVRLENKKIIGECMCMGNREIRYLGKIENGRKCTMNIIDEEFVLRINTYYIGIAKNMKSITELRNSGRSNAWKDAIQNTKMGDIIGLPRAKYEFADLQVYSNKNTVWLMIYIIIIKKEITSEDELVCLKEIIRKLENDGKKEIQLCKKEKELLHRCLENDCDNYGIDSNSKTRIKYEKYEEWLLIRWKVEKSVNVIKERCRVSDYKLVRETGTQYERIYVAEYLVPIVKTMVNLFVYSPYGNYIAEKEKRDKVSLNLLTLAGLRTRKYDKVTGYYIWLYNMVYLTNVECPDTKNIIQYYAIERVMHYWYLNEISEYLYSVIKDIKGIYVAIEQNAMFFSELSYALSEIINLDGAYEADRVKKSKKCIDIVLERHTSKKDNGIELVDMVFNSKDASGILKQIDELKKIAEIKNEYERLLIKYIGEHILQDERYGIQRKFVFSKVYEDIEEEIDKDKCEYNVWIRKIIARVNREYGSEEKKCRNGVCEKNNKYEESEGKVSKSGLMKMIRVWVIQEVILK